MRDTRLIKLCGCCCCAAASCWDSDCSPVCIITVMDNGAKRRSAEESGRPNTASGLATVRRSPNISIRVPVKRAQVVVQRTKPLPAPLSSARLSSPSVHGLLFEASSNETSAQYDSTIRPSSHVVAALEASVQGTRLYTWCIVCMVFMNYIWLIGLLAKSR